MKSKKKPVCETVCYCNDTHQRKQKSLCHSNLNHSFPLEQEVVQEAQIIIIQPAPTDDLH